MTIKSSYVTQDEIELHTGHPFPKRLQSARLKANLSQRELGIKVGLDAGSASSRMNHYEKGRHVPDYSLACKIASELQVPVEYFYCEDDSNAERLLKLANLEPHEVQILDEMLGRHTNEDVDGS